MKSDDDLLDALEALGFSPYEARIYSGLLNGGFGQTAYTLWKSTGVPQPKTYETVKRLIARGVATQVGTHPQRFSARPLDEVLAQLRSDYGARLDQVERTAEEALRRRGSTPDGVRMMQSSTGRVAVFSTAVALIDEARERLYLSLWIDDLDVVGESVARAVARGVSVVALVFGRGRVDLPGATVYRHASTSRVLYHAHQNRHIGVISDGRRGLWGVSYDADDWGSLQFDDRRMVGLLRQFIRHDIYVQRIYDEMGPQLVEVFGPGLERLNELDRRSGDDIRAGEPDELTRDAG